MCVCVCVCVCVASDVVFFGIEVGVCVRTEHACTYKAVK